MKSQLRDLVAGALYPTKAYKLPAVCERYGLAAGTTDEAMHSKTKYVMQRLERMSDEQVLKIAVAVLKDFPDDPLQAAVEMLDKAGHLVTDITRRHLATAMDEFNLAGSQELLELLRKHFPSVDREASQESPFDKLADDINQHMIRNEDWTNLELLERVGFFTCSQTRLFQFLEEVLHPIRREASEQQAMVAKLNPILRRDGYTFGEARPVSGYPTYKILETVATGSQPSDGLISKALMSFDESGVHHAWQKALDRRTADPEGAITAAKTLLETVCKHIIDEAGGSYGDNDDLPKLYNNAAEHLNLAPAQHTEVIFKSILGNCQSIVGNLAGLRNKLGDSHGQGKRHVKPQDRHAELAVNLAGTMATFLISTWKTRKP